MQQCQGAISQNSNSQSKLSGSSWKKYRDEVTGNGDSKSFNFKEGNDGTKVVEIMVPFKYVSNFSRNNEMPLITCETNHF